MHNSKKWYLSKSILGSITAILATILGSFGLQISAEEQESIVMIVANVATSVGALIAIYGRVTANSRLEK